MSTHVITKPTTRVEPTAVYDCNPITYLVNHLQHEADVLDGLVDTLQNSLVDVLKPEEKQTVVAPIEGLENLSIEGESMLFKKLTDLLERHHTIIKQLSKLCNRIEL